MIRIGAIFFYFILICLTLVNSIEASQKEYFDSILQEVDQIDLKFDDTVVASILGILPVDDGFVALGNESAYGAKHLLLKFSKTGKLIKKYSKRGSGPGEFRAIANFIVKDNFILVAERSSPYIHKFSSSLMFIEDFRTKGVGKIKELGNFVGLFSAKAVGEGKQLKNYVLELYDGKTMKFVKHAYEIDDIPAFVITMGGLCKLPGGGFAGVFANQFQIKLFDDQLTFKKNLLSSLPTHAVKYTPWKKSPYTMDKAGLDWINSWSKMHSIHIVKNRFILRSITKSPGLIDVISMGGKYLKEGMIANKKKWIAFIKDDFVWLLKREGEDDGFSLIKCNFTM